MASRVPPLSRGYVFLRSPLSSATALLWTCIAAARCNEPEAAIHSEQYTCTHTRGAATSGQSDRHTRTHLVERCFLPRTGLACVLLLHLAFVRATAGSNAWPRPRDHVWLRAVLACASATWQCTLMARPIPMRSLILLVGCCEGLMPMLLHVEGGFGPRLPVADTHLSAAGDAQDACDLCSALLHARPARLAHGFRLATSHLTAALHRVA